MKTIKWIGLTLAIFFFPVIITYADSGSLKKTGRENAEAGKIANKNEIVYANLQASGSLEEIYVVNAFELDRPGIIEDYGHYSEVKNLTDTSAIAQDNNKIRINAETDMFYYQGNLSDNIQLPWSFTLEYYLDDSKVKAEELIGKSGEVEIKIAVKKTESVPSTFFENYMLQISLPLNTDKFKNIKARDATVANSGKNKQLAFTVMPEEEKEFSIKAKTDHFEIDGLQISALPSSISVDGPDTDELTSEFRSLTDAVGEIDDGVGQLRNGMSELASGLNDLEKGSSQYKSGMDELNQSGSQLTKASSQINHALTAIQNEVKNASGASGLEQLDELNKNIPAMAASLEQIADGMDQFASQYRGAKQGLQDAMNQIPESTIKESDIEALSQSDADQAVINELVKTYQAAQTAKAAYQAAAEAFGAVEPNLSTFSESTRQVANHLRTLAAGLEKSMNQVNVDEGLSELVSGLGQMASNYSQFHEGLSAYTKGVNELSHSYNGLHTGIGEAAAGASQITDGAGELHDGTGQLHDATSAIPDEMQKEIDSMISQYDKSDFDPVSFVSEKNNEQIDSVQFVISTDSLKQKETDTTNKQSEEKEGFFEKLKNLFR